MMFTPTDELEDPIYRMDLYKFPSPLNYFEFDGPVHEWINTLQPHVGTSNEPISKTVMNKGDMNCNHVSTKKAVSRRGASKGDRHSKIPTAHGLRDRRMRLSLEVARQFFKLQDMLSYDKPSKTVKWLLLQAKAAIEGLNKGKESPCSGDVTKCVSSNYSEGEVVESAIGDQEIVNGVSKVITPKEKCKKKRKNDQICPVGKESRKKAREEARERARIRTQEKKHAGFKANVGLGNDSVYETRNMKPTADVTFEIAQQQIQDERTSVGFTQNWSSLMSLSYHQEDDNSCQLCFLQNPIPEAQQFQGTSSQPYNHPNLGHYWY